MGVREMNQQKREDIIDATIELVSVHGFHNAPMAIIAERANVAAGTIYRFFVNKDDLIIKTYICLEQRMITSIMKSYPGRQSIHKRFQHICKELVNYFLLSPMEFRFVEQFFNSPYGTATRRGRIKGDSDIISTLFKEGQQQQVVKSLPLPVLTALAFGPLIQLCRDHVLDYFKLNDDIIDSTVGACWDAIRIK